jgi:hypothetical protein
MTFVSGTQHAKLYSLTFRQDSAAAKLPEPTMNRVRIGLAAGLDQQMAVMLESECALSATEAAKIVRDVKESELEAKQNWEKTAEH